MEEEVVLEVHLSVNVADIKGKVKKVGKKVVVRAKVMKEVVMVKVMKEEHVVESMAEDVEG